MQRLRPVATTSPTHAACHYAAIGPGDQRKLERPLSKMKRSYDIAHPVKVSMTAAL